jgi:hypothetical protein
MRHSPQAQPFQDRTFVATNLDGLGVVDYWNVVRLRVAGKRVGD